MQKNIVLSDISLTPYLPDAKVLQILHPHKLHGHTRKIRTKIDVLN